MLVNVKESTEPLDSIISVFFAVLWLTAGLGQQGSPAEPTLFIK